MDRQTVGSAGVVLASLLFAGSAAALVSVLTEPDASPVESLPVGIEMPQPPVVAARDRAVPVNVRATADVAVSGRAPGLALERVRLETGWEQSRAEIRDLTTGDLRAYAIGDLLPNGSLLVGLSTGTADIMVADVELVRLAVGDSPRTIQDLRSAFETDRLRRAPDVEVPYRRAIEDSVRTLGTAGAETVQAHLDELIACGDPAVELLIAHVGDPEPIAPGPYRIGDNVVDPKIVGDAIIAILESITGQTFGDPTRASASDPERDEISRAWQRWWGVE